MSIVMPIGRKGRALYRRYVKRLLDIILSAAGTVVLSPLFLIIAAAIKIEISRSCILPPEAHRHT